MVHLRIVVPSYQAEHALDLLKATPSVCNVNLAAILLAGVGTLFVQRRMYLRRRVRHLHDEAREAAGLPLGKSRRRARKAATASAA